MEDEHWVFDGSNPLPQAAFFVSKDGNVMLA